MRYGHSVQESLGLQKPTPARKSMVTRDRVGRVGIFRRDDGLRRMKRAPIDLRESDPIKQPWTCDSNHNGED
jgi:hypothetical protein